MIIKYKDTLYLTFIMDQLDTLLERIIQNSLYTHYYINDPLIRDSDDLSSILLLDIVTNFGSPGNDNLHKQMKLIQKNKIKELGKYKKVTVEITNDTCPICIDQFKEGEYYRTLSCNHEFHKKCIDRWFKKDHLDCPMCRKIIIT